MSDELLKRRIPLAGSFLGLQPSKNSGIAFGIRLPPVLQEVLILIALVLVFVLAWRSGRSRWSQVGFGLIFGGALGNIVDRLRDGYVTDFFQVGTFPIFNLADSCITIGVAILLVEMMLHQRNKRGISNF
ncbi:signal peptidase II [Candidatus Peregrinibacteria bacterium]|nr:signal peptidase II [Candidatus Peregrinibacteria bacterium]